uniref:Uncharacterized protein n=1 Tax=Anguilla anguilla TaxID=7936 RepID=A0A0E9UI64_ANGAN
MSFSSTLAVNTKKSLLPDFTITPFRQKTPDANLD